MKPQQSNRGWQPRQRGVGLVEVLVAVLVLSFGLLAISMLQIRSMRNNESALQRSLAVVQSHTIADAMRADRDNAISGGFNLALASTPPTGATFARISLQDWRAALIAVLGPAASGAVNCNGTVCAITVQWNDERGSAGATNFSVTTVVQL